MVAVAAGPSPLEYAMLAALSSPLFAFVVAREPEEPM